MLKLKDICDVEVKFAQVVHEKWQSEAYGLKACSIHYNEKDLEELKLKIILKQANVCCSELK